MVVRTQYQGRRISGLYIGAGNAKKYFSRRAALIEIQLDHLLIRCGLEPRFWGSQPEIQDARICAWLESKQPRTSTTDGPPPLVLTPTGRSAYRLDYLARKAAGRLRSATA